MTDLEEMLPVWRRELEILQRDLSLHGAGKLPRRLPVWVVADMACERDRLIALIASAEAAIAAAAADGDFG